jgi:3-phenylpropionate/trans-cinnamate dioxygenase ferredoxin component
LSDDLHAVGDLSGLADGDIHICEFGDLEIMVCRVAGSLYAIEDLCSHADTPLSTGLLQGYKIVCPLHGAQFDVRDGTHSGPPAYTGVRSFAVTESADGASIDLSEPAPADPASGPPGGPFLTR